MSLGGGAMEALEYSVFSFSLNFINNVKITLIKTSLKTWFLGRVNEALWSYALKKPISFAC